MCDQNANPQYDIPFLNAMIAGGVQARGMPAPSTATDPYMHAKMMIADGARGYVGSMNYSTNSLKEAREVGIIFSDSAALGAFESIFQGDWGNAQVPPASASDVSCPSAG
jgi:phosphatidylserine/phosphatidylglycerophosphate/cardiolipin synthase-like enzyme